MDVIQIIILSIVEGITEFLPISSTGHLVLVSELLNISQTDFVKSFEIIIQSGAILAVIVLFGKRLVLDIDLLKKTTVAFIPTGIIGFLLYKQIKDTLIGNNIVTLTALFLGGIAIIGLEMYFKNKPAITPHLNPLPQRARKNTPSPSRGEGRDEGEVENSINDLSYKKALLIGVFQSISVIPGVSRAAATIFGGMLTGLDRKTAVEFSFILAIPTMFATTGYDLYKSASSFSSDQMINLAVGFTLSFIVALAAVKWLLRFIQTNTFIPFGIYRIILALLFFIFVLK